MRIYAYIHMYVCAYAFVYAYIHTYTHLIAHAQHIGARTFTHIRCIYTCRVYMHTTHCIHKHTYKQTYGMHICIHKYIPTCTITCMCVYECASNTHTHLQINAQDATYVRANFVRERTQTGL